MLALGTVGPVAGAGAQAVDDPYAAFGGLNAHARSGGVQVSYDVEGVLPLPPPLLAVTVPTSRATTTSGPTSLAFGSLAYPGDLIGNLPSLAEQSSPGSGALVPPYPLAVLADHPAGPSEARQDIGTASATVAANPDGALARTTMAATDVPGVIAVGAVTTTTRTGIEDGRLVARSRSQISSLSLLFGAVELADVVVDVVASTDGSQGATDGTVTVGSASVLGTPARIGPEGLDAGPLGDLLTPAGIGISVGRLDRTTDGAGARVDGSALRVTLELDGREGALAPLLALLPADQLPGQGVPGVPINTSPQALVNLLKETHVVAVDLAPVTARVDASPRFVGDDAPILAPPSPAAVGALPELPDIGGDFTTPLPPGGAPVAPIADIGGVVAGRAVEAALAWLVVLSLPLWWRGSAWLLDACLAGPAAGCAAEPAGGREGGR